MKIKKLKINQFRGLKDLEFDLQEINVFSGKNELGKTSVIDSVLWVLTGETLVYGKQDSDNRNEHNLKDVVNVIVEFENGLVLERKYYDVWKEDLEGNLRFSRVENQFYINGAKYKQQEYFDFIKEMLGLKTIIKPKEINLLRALVDYNYLGTIDYKITREFYENLLGLQSDLELLSQDKYMLISADMQALRYDMAKCKSKYETALKENSKEIQTTESIVVMKNNSIDEKEVANYNRYIEERMNLLKENIYDQEEYIKKKQELDKIVLDIQNAEKNLLEQINHANELQNKQINKGNELKNEILRLEKEIENGSDKIDFLRNNTIPHYEKLKQLENEKEFPVVECPHCHKSLNDFEKSNFERMKKDTLYRFEKEIDKTRNTINEITKNITQANERLKQLENEFNEAEKNYNENTQKIHELNLEKENNAVVNELNDKKVVLENELNLFINNYNNNKLQRITELDNAINESAVHVKNKNDLEIYNNALKQLKNSRAKLETQKDLVMEFKREKIQMLKENTSKVFPNIEIELIEVNENTENTKDVCYAKFKDVKYAGMNDGNKILLGITIIENIRKALGLKNLPIIFDKFADVDNTNQRKILDVTSCQILTTSVTEDDTITIKGVK